MKQINNQLMQLLHNNPGLPLIPMVSFDVVGGSVGQWLGMVEKAVIKEYWQDLSTGNIYFRDEQDGIVEALCDHIEYASAEKIEHMFLNLPWQKAIFLYIVPDKNMNGGAA